MQFRTLTLVWSAAGLLAVGTTTGLAAPTLLHYKSPPGSGASPADSMATAATMPNPIPPITAPNYRAIVARNQAAVVGITTAGTIDGASRDFNFGGPPGDNDNPPLLFFRGAPIPRNHGVLHAQGSGF